MNKEELLKEIENAKTIAGRNIMGCSESFYNAYYSVRECFGMEELKKMDEKELNDLLKLGDFLAEVFY